MARRGEGRRVGNRIAPLRFLAFLALLAAGVGAGLRFGLPCGRALLVGFDAASAIFLVTLFPLWGDQTGEIRTRAAENDANRAVLLGITALVTLVVLVAVANELSGKPGAYRVALVIATLALAWLFTNTIYALHYAHLYYGDRDSDDEDDRGLTFPDCDEPDYSDFIYLSFCLGMTFQTSDVEIASRRVRRVVTGHCLAAFVFNLGVLAFTINVLGGGG